jgi:hypothetical protein
VQTLPFVFTTQLGPDDLQAFGRRLSGAD